MTKGGGLFRVMLSGDYSDPPGVVGVDIKDIQLSTQVLGFSMSVLPNYQGDRSPLDAEIRVVPEIEGRSSDGRPIVKSALNVRYNHTIAVGGEPLWRRVIFYGF